MLPRKENLEVEFKSEQRHPFSDHDLVDNVVALANTNGGELYIGVEDDGTPTGVNPKHMNPYGIAAYVFNHTVPPQSVRAEIVHDGHVPILRIEVDASEQIVCTSGGRSLQRVLKGDGAPEVLPLFPAQYISRLSSLRQYDYSAQAAPDASLDDFDDTARMTLRNNISASYGDDNLLSLDDADFDKALGFVVDTRTGKKPTIAGLLMIGSTEALRRSVPTAKVRFQVLEQAIPRVNGEAFVLPLVRVLQRIDEMIMPWNHEREIDDGMLRIRIPDYDANAIREAAVNALCHRDYSLMGEVRFLIDENGLTVSSPGGFVNGVNANTLLTTSPKPRNPLLADVLKRAGYAERTGRGVDKIYAAAVRSGRPLPDYSGSSATEVVLTLSDTAPDERLVLFVRSLEKKRSAPLPVESLVILSVLWSYHRLDVSALARITHLSITRVMSAADELLIGDLVRKTGTDEQAWYEMIVSADDHSSLLPGEPDVRDSEGCSNSTYLRDDAGRSNGISRRVKSNDDEEVLNLVKSRRGPITVSDVQTAFDMSYITAYRLLKKLVARRLLTVSNGKPARYSLPEMS